MDIQEQIKELQSQLDKLKSKVAEPKKLPYNAWYKHKDGAIVYFTNNERGYGVSGVGEWCNHNELDNLNSGIWHPYPHSEVEAMMRKEAEKRGFVKVVRYQDASVKYNHTPSVGKDEFNLIQTSQMVGLTDGFGGYIFYNGQWAEIIKEDVIEIGGYVVAFNAAVGNIFVNNKYYSKNEVEAAKKVLQFGGKIMVGCSHQYELTLDTVNKILAKL